MTGKIITLLGLIGAVMFMTGCASGPRYQAMHPVEPALASGNGRIYFYRIDRLGSALQPAVVVDGAAAGTAVLNRYFFVDCPAGSHEISIDTEVKRTVVVTLAANQRRYVRLNVVYGIYVGHIWPELVPDQVAEGEIQSCRYLGK